MKKINKICVLIAIIFAIIAAAALAAEYYFSRNEVFAQSNTGSYCYRNGECRIAVKGDENEIFFVLVNGDEEMINVKWHLAPIGFNADSPEWDEYEYIWWSSNLPPEYGDRYVIPEL